MMSPDIKTLWPLGQSGGRFTMRFTDWAGDEHEVDIGGAQLRELGDAISDVCGSSYQDGWDDGYNERYSDGARDTEDAKQ